ncbi:MAG: elongation factor Ts [Hyphomicrobiaceae bacterium]|nr:elongation factor Ts [Hyphomicrobiaceae bacterium]
MTTITASLVKELRDMTGAGMMDCKAALTETAGDKEAAVDWLRKKGLAKAAKKSGRTAAEGLVGVASSGTKASVIELNSETDFVSRNEQFQALARKVAELSLAADGDVAAIGALAFEGSAGGTVASAITEAVATIGENMTLRRAGSVSVSDGVVATYVHGAVADGLGKLGVLVGLESTGDKAKLAELGKKIAMHVAAHDPRPAAVRTEEVDPAVVERERAIFAEQAAASGKPAAVVEKMVEGRIRKFYEEVTLLKQHFVINPDVTVEGAVEALAKELGTPVKVTAFVRMALGEGVQKEESDFAAEVAAAAGTK